MSCQLDLVLWEGPSLIGPQPEFSWKDVISFMELTSTPYSNSDSIGTVCNGVTCKAYTILHPTPANGSCLPYPLHNKNFVSICLIVLELCTRTLMVYIDSPAYYSACWLYSRLVNLNMLGSTRPLFICHPHCNYRSLATTPSKSALQHTVSYAKFFSTILYVVGG